MKSSFYLKHDLDAREDQNVRALIMKLGARGYGIYWMIVEDLYRSKGRLARDYDSMAWAYREPQLDVKKVAEDFQLFYERHGKIACHRVDRDLDSRREASEKASIAGKASAAQRALNSRSSVSQPGEERRGEEGEDKTAAPSAADLSRIADSKHVKHALNKSDAALLEIQLPFQFGDIPRGRRVIDIDPVSAQQIIEKTPRLGLDLRRALLARIEIKKSEAIIK